MKLDKIYTNRNFETWPSWDLVFEWENIFKEKLGLDFAYFNKKFLKFGNRIPLLKQFFIHEKLLVYEMRAIKRNHFFNHKNVVICIIDYYLDEEEIVNFEKAYNKNPIVLISSLEVYEYLLKAKCNLKIDHLPLSISDHYRLDKKTNLKKEYDLVLMGRQNPVFEKYLEEYIKKFPNLRYVYRKQVNNQFLYFTSDGESLGDINTREKYINLMRKSRIGLYSTPGIDGGEKVTKGFNQVTPRFLELIACGCHVIARYKKNQDTEYYRIDNFSRNIDTYEKFEEDLNFKLTTNINLEYYIEYLNEHYTSTRVLKLEEILKNI